MTDSLDRQAQAFGRDVLATFEALMDAVYAARAAPEPPPPGALRQQHAARLQWLFEPCHCAADSTHAKTAALARERALTPWPYLAEVICQRRRGLPAPPLPQPAT